VLTNKQIREALEHTGITVVLERDYIPSRNMDRAAYQEIDFRERVWRDLVLTATRRRKMSRQLLSSQTAISLMKTGLKGAVCARILTQEAAVRLQNAGYHLKFPASDK
jgi:hypothetical protein